MSAPGTNWQLTLADLAIILFLTTFSALARESKAPHTVHPPHARSTTVNLAVAEPVALWRSGEGSPPLGAWLHQQPVDSRVRINIVGAYGPDDRDYVLSEANDLSKDPALIGRATRLILEPAEASSVIVTLSYDQS